MKKSIFALFLLGFAPVASANFDQNLSYGASGPKVIELQEFLTDQKVYSGPITGNFYTLTLAAVKNFQSANNITPVSGFFGPLTREAANSLLTRAIGGAIDAEIEETGTTTTPDNHTEDLAKEMAKLRKELEESRKTKSVEYVYVPTNNGPQNQTQAPVTPTIEENTESEPGVYIRSLSNVVSNILLGTDNYGSGNFILETKGTQYKRVYVSPSEWEYEIESDVFTKEDVGVEINPNQMYSNDVNLAYYRMENRRRDFNVGVKVKGEKKGTFKVLVKNVGVYTNLKIIPTVPNATYELLDKAPVKSATVVFSVEVK